MEYIKLTEEEFLELRGLQNGVEESGEIDLADFKDPEDLVRMLDAYRRLGQLEMKEMIANEQSYEMV
jgi:hypothetical protein